MSVQLVNKIVCEECRKGRKIRYDCTCATDECKCPKSRWSCACTGPDKRGRFECDCCRICKHIRTQKFTSTLVFKLRKQSKEQRTKILYTGKYKSDTCSKCLQSVLHTYNHTTDGEPSAGNSEFSWYTYGTFTLVNTSIEQLHERVISKLKAFHKKQIGEKVCQRRLKEAIQAGRALSEKEVSDLWKDYVEVWM
jgi:hypothetical protein